MNLILSLIIATVTSLPTNEFQRQLYRDLRGYNIPKETYTQVNEGSDNVGGSCSVSNSDMNYSSGYEYETKNPEVNYKDNVNAEVKKDRDGEEITNSDSNVDIGVNTIHDASSSGMNNYDPRANKSKILNRDQINDKTERNTGKSQGIVSNSPNETTDDHFVTSDSSNLPVSNSKLNPSISDEFDTLNNTNFINSFDLENAFNSPLKNGIHPIREENSNFISDNNSNSNSLVGPGSIENLSTNFDAENISSLNPNTNSATESQTKEHSIKSTKSSSDLSPMEIFNFGKELFSKFNTKDQTGVSGKRDVQTDYDGNDKPSPYLNQVPELSTDGKSNTETDFNVSSNNDNNFGESFFNEIANKFNSNNGYKANNEFDVKSNVNQNDIPTANTIPDAEYNNDDIFGSRFINNKLDHGSNKDFVSGTSLKNGFKLGFGTNNGADSDLITDSRTDSTLDNDTVPITSPKSNNAFNKGSHSTTSFEDGLNASFDGISGFKSDKNTKSSPDFSTGHNFAPSIGTHSDAFNSGVVNQFNSGPSTENNFTSRLATDFDRNGVPSTKTSNNNNFGLKDNSGPNVGEEVKFNLGANNQSNSNLNIKNSDNNLQDNTSIPTTNSGSNFNSHSGTEENLNFITGTKPNSQFDSKPHENINVESDGEIDDEFSSFKDFDFKPKSYPEVNGNLHMLNRINERDDSKLGNDLNPNSKLGNDLNPNSKLGNDFEFSRKDDSEPSAQNRLNSIPTTSNHSLRNPTHNFNVNFGNGFNSALGTSSDSAENSNTSDIGSHVNQNFLSDVSPGSKSGSTFGHGVDSRNNTGFNTGSDFNNVSFDQPGVDSNLKSGSNMDSNFDNNFFPATEVSSDINRGKDFETGLNTGFNVGSGFNDVFGNKENVNSETNSSSDFDSQNHPNSFQGTKVSSGIHHGNVIGPSFNVGDRFNEIFGDEKRMNSDVNSGSQFDSQNDQNSSLATESSSETDNDIGFGTGNSLSFGSEISDVLGDKPQVNSDVNPGSKFNSQTNQKSLPVTGVDSHTKNNIGLGSRFGDGFNSNFNHFFGAKNRAYSNLESNSELDSQNNQNSFPDTKASSDINHGIGFGSGFNIVNGFNNVFGDKPIIDSNTNSEFNSENSRKPFQNTEANSGIIHGIRFGPDFKFGNGFNNGVNDEQGVGSDTNSDSKFDSQANQDSFSATDASSETNNETGFGSGFNTGFDFGNGFNTVLGAKNRGESDMNSNSGFGAQSNENSFPTNESSSEINNDTGFGSGFNTGFNFGNELDTFFRAKNQFSSNPNAGLNEDSQINSNPSLASEAKTEADNNLGFGTGFKNGFEFGNGFNNIFGTKDGVDSEMNSSSDVHSGLDQASFGSNEAKTETNNDLGFGDGVNNGLEFGSGFNTVFSNNQRENSDMDSISNVKSNFNDNSFSTTETKTETSIGQGLGANFNNGFEFGNGFNTLLGDNGRENSNVDSVFNVNSISNQNSFPTTNVNSETDQESVSGSRSNTGFESGSGFNTLHKTKKLFGSVLNSNIDQTSGRSTDVSLNGNYNPHFDSGLSFDNVLSNRNDADSDTSIRSDNQPIRNNFGPITDPGFGLGFNTGWSAQNEDNFRLNTGLDTGSQISQDSLHINDASSNIDYNPIIGISNNGGSGFGHGFNLGFGGNNNFNFGMNPELDAQSKINQNNIPLNGLSSDIQTQPRESSSVEFNRKLQYGRNTRNNVTKLKSDYDDDFESQFGTKPNFIPSAYNPFSSRNKPNSGLGNLFNGNFDLVRNFHKPYNAHHGLRKEVGSPFKPAYFTSLPKNHGYSNGAYSVKRVYKKYSTSKPKFSAPTNINSKSNVGSDKVYATEGSSYPITSYQY